MATSVPTAAATGAKLTARGGWITVRAVALAAVPSVVVIMILPVTAPSGTVNVTCVALDVIEPGGTTKVPILTTGVVAPTFRLNPSTVTTAVLPPTAVGGAKPVIFGSTLKLAVVAPVPPGSVTLTGPVSAPAGTTAC